MILFYHVTTSNMIWNVNYCWCVNLENLRHCRGPHCGARAASVKLLRPFLHPKLEPNLPREWRIQERALKCSVVREI